MAGGHLREFWTVPRVALQKAKVEPLPLWISRPRAAEAGLGVGVPSMDPALALRPKKAVRP